MQQLPNMGFLKKLFGANDANDANDSHIHRAARCGDLDAIGRLLNGSPGLVSNRNYYGNTPLHVAAIQYRWDAVELLLDRKANVNARNNMGETPLHWAAELGFRRKAEVLLANKADVNAEDKCGATPLWWAETRDRTDVVELPRRHRGTVQSPRGLY